MLNLNSLYLIPILLLIYLYIKYFYIDVVPTHFKNIPVISTNTVVLAIISGQELVDRINNIVLPKISLLGYVVVRLRGRWGLILGKSHHIKEALNHPEVFLKRDKNENISKLLFEKYMGKSNILTSDLNLWKKHRKVINPAFKISWDMDIFYKGATELISKIESQANANIKIHEWFQRLTIDVLGRGLLDYEFSALSSGDDDKNFRIYQNLMRSIFAPIYFLFPMLEKINPLRRKYHSLLLSFRQFLSELIESRRNQLVNKKREIPNDLISLMLVNSMDNGDDPLTSEEVVNNLSVFFLAGHETTANTLTSVLYFLAKHQDIQTKARKEIHKILGDSKELNKISYDQQKGLEYLTMVIKESMRLITTVAEIRRYVAKDYTFSDGLVVKKGNFVLLNYWCAHHDGAIFPEPDKFDPERFRDPHGLQANNWIPFSYGTRICVGMNFSLIEQRVVLSTLLKKYQITLGLNSSKWDHVKLSSSGLVYPKDLDLIFTPIF